MTRSLRLTLSVEYEIERGETIEDALEMDSKQFQEDIGAAVDFFIHHYNTDSEIKVSVEKAE